MKAALLDAYLAVYTRYGLVWYGPTDWHDISYRLAMRLAGHLQCLLVLPRELDPAHRRQAAFEASSQAADQMVRLGQAHPFYLAWETVYIESLEEYLNA